MHILCIADDRIGVQNQAIGLGEAIAVRLPGTRLQTLIVGRADKKLFAKGMRTLPDLAIGCGRHAASELRALKARGVKTIYVQDPRRGYGRYDLIVAPEHDQVKSRNTVSMIGSPNRITDTKLAASEAEWAELSTLPAPHVAVLLGGPTKRHNYSEDVLATHMGAMAKVLAVGGSLLISTSRRTPETMIAGLRKLAEKHPKRIHLYSGDGPNPYLGYLAHAEAILVTEDSTNMLTEACAVGVQVTRLPMTGRPEKFGRLYQQLSQACGVQSWDGELRTGKTPTLQETARVADNIIARLGLRQG